MDDRHHRDDSRPAQAKKLKKKIASLWKSIGKALERNRAVTESDAEKILRACADYTLFTEKKWQADWQRCVEAVKISLDLAKNDDHAGARQAAAHVDLLTRSCHRQYK